MKANAFRLTVLVCLVIAAGPGTAAAQAGWMQTGVRVWYLGAVGGGGVTSSNAEEAYLFSAMAGGNARVVHHSALTHWTSPQPVDTTSHPVADRGPCWIHPARLQTLQMGEYWMGQEITLVVHATYTYQTFISTALPAKAHMLPIKALFAIAPQREIVKITYMMPYASFGTAYFDAATGILLYRDAIWGINRMFFMLAEINYDFAAQVPFAEDAGPHTGFKAFVCEQSLGSSWGAPGGGSIVMQFLVETRYGQTIEMRVLSSFSSTGYRTADENYCFFGDVPILRRIDATLAPDVLPEQWNPYGEYLPWWLPPAVTQAVPAPGGRGEGALPNINVYNVPMAKTADQPLTYAATQAPSAFYFSTLWFGADGYLTQFAAKDPTIGLDVRPGDLIFQNLTAINGASYYQSTMALPVFTDDPLQVRGTSVKAVHVTELRSRIDALRARYTLGAFAWTDATLAPGTTVVRAVHVAELRAALAAVYTAASRTPPAWTPPTIVGGTTAVTAAQIAEIRNAVLAVW